MGRHLRNYEVQGEIGRGGMATVHKALHTELDRVVAIKELQSSYRSDEEMVERFKREAKAVASLVHANIVQTYDFWWNKSGCYLVMEYVDGVDLKQILQQCRTFPIPVFASIGVLLCDALAYAHEKGIIHRDVKLSNVLISKKGEVKLTDFGIAQLLNSQDLTPSGILLGTPAYMSPEQIQGESLAPTTDIFSLGVVFYEMLTGKKPFSDGNDTQIIFQILKAKPSPPRFHNSRIPYGVQRLVLKCLKKKPSKRFRSMGELRKALSYYCSPKTSEPAEIIRVFLRDLSSGKIQEERALAPRSKQLGEIMIRAAIVILILTLFLIPALFYYLYTIP